VTAAHGAPLEAAVELLERSLGYTRVMLADVGPRDFRRPTPCVGWTLGRLLDHMEDGLDAFTAAAAGHVDVTPAPPTATRVDALREKACALLGAWTSARPVQVTVGDGHLGAPLLVGTAALEITVHGWDVGRATGRRTPIPRDLARGLLPVAQLVVDATDRRSRFGAALSVSAAAPQDVRLLAHLGRSARRDLTGPLDTTSGEAHSRPEVAS
jgi:uncharacterized protein (TIGR03086 family)